jgi:hypothetical protein
MSEPWRCGTCGQGYPCECRILGVAHPDGGAPPEPPGPELMRAYNQMCPMGHVAGLRAVYELGLRAASRPGHP